MNTPLGRTLHTIKSYSLTKGISIWAWAVWREQKLELACGLSCFRVPNREQPLVSICFLLSYLIENANLNEIDECLSDKRQFAIPVAIVAFDMRTNGCVCAWRGGQNQMQLNLNQFDGQEPIWIPERFWLCLAFITCRNYIAPETPLAATFKAAHWFGTIGFTLIHSPVQWLVINQSKRNFSHSIKSITKSAIFSEPRMLSCLCHVEQRQLPVASCQLEWRQRPCYVYAPVGMHAKDIKANEWMPNPRQSIVCFYIMRLCVCTRCVCVCLCGCLAQFLCLFSLCMFTLSICLAFDCFACA